MTRPRTPTRILETSVLSFVIPSESVRVKGSQNPTPRSEIRLPNWTESTRPSGVKLLRRSPWSASNCDEVAFEILVCLIVGFRQRQRQNMPQIVGEIAQMNKLLAQFGMTPADRGRVHAETTIETKD